MKNKILNFLIYGFGQSINILGPLLIVPFIIAICNEDGLGKVGISFSLSLIFCCIIDYSSTIIGTKNTSINRDNVEILRNLFCDFFLTKLLILSILIALLIFGVYSIPYLQQEKTLFLLIIPLLIAQLFNINWILQGLEKFKLIAIFNVLSKGSYILLVFLLINKKQDYIWVNFFLGISNLFFNIIASIYIIKKLNINLKSFSIQNSIKLLKSDFRICASEFCLAIYQFFPIIIVGYIVGNTGAGIFKIIEQIISVFRTYIFMFFNFSYPTICFDLEKDSNKGYKTWLVYHTGNTIIIAFGCLFIYFIKDYVFDFFRVSNELLPTLNSLLKIGIFIPIIISISQAFRQLLLGKEIIKHYTMIIYASTIINIVLIYLLTKVFELKGVLFATIIIEFLVIFSFAYFIKKNNKYQTVL